MTAPALPARRPSLMSWLLLVLGTLGFAAAWTTLSLWNDRSNAWMAVLGALDVAFLLRLGHWPRGGLRATFGIIALAAMTLLATWGSIAGHLGRAFGLTPWASSLRLGAHHAWTLADLIFSPVDLAWLVAGLVLAAIASR